MAYVFGTEEAEKAYKKLVEERLATRPKPYIVGTPEWAATYERMLQEDPEFKEYGKGWKGSVVIHTLAYPEIGLEKDSYLFMDLHDGECRSIRYVPKEVGEQGDYIITGSYETWKSIAKGELDTNKAVMQGKLKLKGDLATIVRYAKSSARMNEISSSIEAIYPDELSQEELEKFLEETKKLQEEFGL